MNFLLTKVSSKKEEWFAALMWSLKENHYEYIVRKVDEELLRAGKAPTGTNTFFIYS